MFFQKTLMIQHTNKCNFTCRHCIVSGNSCGRKRVDLKKTIEIINELSEIISKVILLGGEPFLFLDELLELIKYAGSLSLETEVNTNGFWGREDVDSVLKQLELNKLGILDISVDKYHLKFIDFKTILDIVKQVKNYKIKAVIFLTYDTGRTENDLLIKRLSEVNNELTFINQPVLPLGRAKNISFHKSIKGFPAIKPCEGLIEHFLSLDGNVYSCCVSAGMGKGSPLYLGNIKNRRIVDIFYEAAFNPTITILRKYGPVGLLSVLEKHGVNCDKWKPNRYVSDCHLCSLIMQQRFITKILSKILIDDKIDIPEIVSGNKTNDEYIPSGGASNNAFKLKR